MSSNGTVLDQFKRPVHDLRISVTDRCNLRCHYCMPEEVFGHDYPFLKKEELLSFDQITLLAKAFAQMGVRKIRLTGGEPLLRPDLHLLIQMLADIPQIEDIALTTNATRLAAQIDKLKEAGLNRITVSLDALDEAVFQKMNGEHASVANVLRGIEAALKAGMPLKINCVLEKGVNEDQILPLARFGREKGVTVRFIEFMDVGNHNQWSMQKVVPSQEVIDTIARNYPLSPLPATHPGEVANRFSYDDGQSEVGVISSITKPFCKDCTRARLSADGQLYTCLFASKGHNLKPILSYLQHSDVYSVTYYLSRLWESRDDRYSELRVNNAEGGKPPKVEMFYIGG